MAHEQPGGLFVVLEGADGSGKSTLVDHLVPLLHRSGRTVRRINRSSPEGHPAHVSLVRAVDQVFRTAHATPASWELLSLAAAAQYRSILHAQIEPAIKAGEIVIAESWWDKTWIRFGLEAEICLDLSEAQQRALGSWQRRLLPPGPLPAHWHLTVLVQADQQDRVCWYKAAGCPDSFYDRWGAVSHNPDEYGYFTECIAERLRDVADDRGWPIVANGVHRDAVDVAADLHQAIEDHLAQPAVPVREIT
jgi:energy-coupling factor transporter ATP-binding protein EcfA2